MNQSQIISWITTGIGLVGSAAATKGLIDESTATSIVGMAVTLVPLIWGFFSHSNTSVVQQAGAISGVKPVEITPSAAPELQKLAMDPTVPSVVVAAPTYVPPSASMRR